MPVSTWPPSGRSATRATWSTTRPGASLYSIRAVGRPPSASAGSELASQRSQAALRVRPTATRGRRTSPLSREQRSSCRPIGPPRVRRSVLGRRLPRTAPRWCASGAFTTDTGTPQPGAPRPRWCSAKEHVSDDRVQYGEQDCGQQCWPEPGDLEARHQRGGEQQHQRVDHHQEESKGDQGDRQGDELQEQADGRVHEPEDECGDQSWTQSGHPEAGDEMSDGEKAEGGEDPIDQQVAHGVILPHQKEGRRTKPRRGGPRGLPDPRPRRGGEGCRARRAPSRLPYGVGSPREGRRGSESMERGALPGRPMQTARMPAAVATPTAPMTTTRRTNDSLTAFVRPPVVVTST